MHNKHKTFCKFVNKRVKTFYIFVQNKKFNHIKFNNKLNELEITKSCKCVKLLDKMRQMRHSQFFKLIFVNPYKFSIYKFCASMRRSS